MKTSKANLQVLERILKLLLRSPARGDERNQSKQTMHCQRSEEQSRRLKNNLKLPIMDS
jgi:hypothetical protein